MVFKSLQDRVSLLLEDPGKIYKFENLYTYSSDPKTNGGIIKKLNALALKHPTLWSINLKGMKESLWTKRVKKLKIKKESIIRDFYDNNPNGLDKGALRNDVLALFLQSPSDILEFYSQIPELNIINPLTQAPLSHALAETTINYFNKVQSWYGVFLIKDPNLFIEICPTKVFNKIIGQKGFYSPINVVSKPALDPITNNKIYYCDIKCLACDDKKIKERFFDVSGYQNYSALFMNKLLTQAKRDFVEINKKTNLKAGNPIEELSELLKETYKSKKLDQYFSSNTLNNLEKLGIDPDITNLYNTLENDPFFLHKTIKNNIDFMTKAKSFQLKMFLNCFRASILIPENITSSIAIAELQSLLIKFFPLLSMINIHEYLKTNSLNLNQASLISKYPKKLEAQLIKHHLNISQDLLVVSIVLNDLLQLKLPNNNNFQKDLVKTKLNFMVNYEISLVFLEGKLIEKTASKMPFYTKNDLEVFRGKNVGKMFNQMHLFKYGGSSNEDIENANKKEKNVNLLISRLLENNSNLIEKEIEFNTNRLLYIIYITMLEMLVFYFKPVDISKTFIGVKKKKQRFDVSVHKTFHAIPAFAIPFETHEEFDNSIYDVNQVTQQLSFRLVSTKGFIIYNSGLRLGNSNSEELGPIFNTSKDNLNNFEEIAVVLYELFSNTVQNLFIHFPCTDKNGEQSVKLLPILAVRLYPEGSYIYHSTDKLTKTKSIDLIYKKEFCNEDDFTIEEHDVSIRPCIFPVKFIFEKGIVNFDRKTDSNISELDMPFLNISRIIEIISDHFDPKKKKKVFDGFTAQAGIIQKDKDKDEFSEVIMSDPTAFHLYINRSLEILINVADKKALSNKFNEKTFLAWAAGQYINAMLQQSVFSASNIYSFHGINTIYQTKFNQQLNQLITTKLQPAQKEPEVLELSEQATYFDQPFFNFPTEKEFNEISILDFIEEISYVADQTKHLNPLIDCFSFDEE